ncbi:NAD-dependent epimerase/dehydratase family protein [Nocardioides sp. LMS-CY]|uniref:NAD-dependent epimerase/dehydratase family protein n=1 Tax=Nocardioides sp. (strain LMS-CY) TaxID=2840457 RepID=UPI001C000294|nr:NAD-dependent epimerase/dehydratase family protein [Nocardioides sp. LMS-CY]QWF21712.1 NAD-dependent epimerase/dehydratase family protein [Nocardioides sp. LMS-CY]
MRYLVTGAAGFIGSHLSATLLERGHSVWGVDSFTDYYSRDAKEANLAYVGEASSFEFEERRVGSIDSSELRDVDAVVHLAAQPGVRGSWDNFSIYLDENLAETNSLLDATLSSGTRRVVMASSSSVYGNSTAYPTSEGALTSPRSPYGVTKRACEDLARAYAMDSTLEILGLRFFTVYGPGQRPDMAIQRLLASALGKSDDIFKLFGSGEQVRDFTFVSDVVDACVRAAECVVEPGFVPVNVGGSGEVSMNELLDLVENVTGNAPVVERMEAQRGDVMRTGASSALAEMLMGWKPTVSITEGLARQAAFVLDPSARTWRV